MSTSHDVHELAAAYALGALDREEAAAFEQAMAADPALVREVEEFRELASLIALDAEHAAPRRELRARVLASTPANGPAVAPISSARRTRSSVLPWLATAAAVALFGWAWLERREIAADLAAQDSVVDGQLVAIASRDSLLAGLLAPGVSLYQLTSSGDPEPVVQLFWNEARGRAIVHALRLPAVDTARVYQLWFIRGDVPVPSVTFRPDADGAALLPDVPVPDGAAAAAVTEEPLGGSPAPTSPILLLSTLRQS